MSGQVLKRPLDQCSPEASKRFRHDIVEHYNRQPEVVAAIQQLREKYGVDDGIITAILETCHYNINDAQREIEKFCLAVSRETSCNDRKRPLPSNDGDSSSNCHPMEPLADQCLAALQNGVQTQEEARRRLCMVLEPLLDSYNDRSGETKKIERLTHANTVLYGAYNTLTEKLQMLRRKAQEDEEAAAATVNRLEQEKQVLQWHLDQVNRPGLNRPERNW